MNPLDDLPSRICPHVLSCISKDNGIRGSESNNTNEETEFLDIENIMNRLNAIADELNLSNAVENPIDFLKSVRKPEQAKMDRENKKVVERNEVICATVEVIEKPISTNRLYDNVLPTKRKRSVKNFQGMDMRAASCPPTEDEIENLMENWYKKSLLDKLTDSKYSMLEKLYYIHEFEGLFGRSLQISHDSITKPKYVSNLYESGLMKDWEFMI
jgi:hypothetical protein